MLADPIKVLPYRLSLICSGKPFLDFDARYAKIRQATCCRDHQESFRASRIIVVAIRGRQHACACMDSLNIIGCGDD